MGARNAVPTRRERVLALAGALLVALTLLAPVIASGGTASTGDRHAAESVALGSVDQSPFTVRVDQPVTTSTVPQLSAPPPVGDERPASSPDHSRSGEPDVRPRGPPGRR